MMPKSQMHNHWERKSQRDGAHSPWKRESGKDLQLQKISVGEGVEGRTRMRDRQEKDAGLSLIGSTWTQLVQYDHAFLFAFQGHTLGKWKFPGQGSNLSHVCNLHHSSQQCLILNPLSKARDPTHILKDTSQIHFCCTTMGTLWNVFLNGFRQQHKINIFKKMKANFLPQRSFRQLNLKSPWPAEFRFFVAIFIALAKELFLPHFWNRS